MYEQAKIIIQDYILDCKAPRCRMRHEVFETRSYKRWAAKELLYYVSGRVGVKPEDAVKEFALMMDLAARKNKRTSRPFIIAKEVAENILDIFSAMK